MNDLEITAVGIYNAYLKTETKQKMLFYSRDEWEPDQGKAVVIVRFLYGIKSSSLEYINHLSDILGKYMVFKSSLGDPGVWFKAST